MFGLYSFASPAGLSTQRVWAVMLQLLQVARVPFATRSAEMTELGRTAQAWNWFKMMKRRSVLLWDQITSENTDSSLFRSLEIWSVALFFHLSVSRSEATADLQNTITLELLTSPNVTRQFGNMSLKWGGRNTSPQVPVDCKKWSSVTYAVSPWRCSQSHCNTGSPSTAAEPAGRAVFLPALTHRYKLTQANRWHLATGSAQAQLLLGTTLTRSIWTWQERLQRVGCSAEEQRWVPLGSRLFFRLFKQ